MPNKKTTTERLARAVAGETARPEKDLREQIAELVSGVSGVAPTHTRGRHAASARASAQSRTADLEPEEEPEERTLGEVIDWIQKQDLDTLQIVQRVLAKAIAKQSAYPSQEGR